MSYDASATWSGFNYQGKVAIFHTLKFINEKLDVDPEFDFSTYELILENHEDFEIKQGDTLISIHQVKAYNNTSFSKYEDALIELAFELERFPDVKGHLHTWKAVSIPIGETLLSKIESSIKTVIAEHNSVIDKSTSIIGKALGDAATIPKRAKIIKRAFKDLGIVEPTEQQVKDYLHQIVTIGTGSPNRISCYQYPSGDLSCELDALTSLITTQLNFLFIKTAEFNTEKQSENAFNFVLGKLDGHIVERHENLNQGDPIPITFDEIIEVIQTDFEDSSTEYVEQKFKRKFLSLMPHFCHDPDLCDKIMDCADQDDCHWRVATNRLCTLSAKKLWNYYLSFSPQKNLASSCNVDNIMEIDSDAILNTLFPIFHTLKSDKVQDIPDKNYFCYRSGEDCSDMYLPTTICQGTPNQLARGILLNPLMLSRLYEIRNLICDENVKNIENLEFACNRIKGGITLTDYTDNLIGVEREKMTDIKNNLRVITQSNAEGIINVD